MATVNVRLPAVVVDVERWAEEYGCAPDVLEAQQDAESYLRTILQECPAAQAGLISIEEG